MYAKKFECYFSQVNVIWVTSENTFIESLLELMPILHPEQNAEIKTNKN
jgi:hypothetical protein